MFSVLDMTHYRVLNKEPKKIIDPEKFENMRFFYGHFNMLVNITQAMHELMAHEYLPKFIGNFSWFGFCMICDCL